MLRPDDPKIYTCMAFYSYKFHPDGVCTNRTTWHWQGGRAIMPLFVTAVSSNMYERVDGWACEYIFCVLYFLIIILAEVYRYP